MSNPEIKWIPIMESLPDDDCSCLVTVKMENQAPCTRVAYFIKDCKDACVDPEGNEVYGVPVWGYRLDTEWGVLTVYTMEMVTHWAELPAPAME